MYLSESGYRGFFSQSCSLERFDAALCTNYLSISKSGTTATEMVTVTPSGTDLQYLQIPITAGGEALATTGASACTSSAVSSKSGNAASKGIE